MASIDDAIFLMDDDVICNNNYDYSLVYYIN